MILSIHPLAADELVDGAVFYAHEGSVDLAEHFVAEFERSLGLLRTQPKLGSIWHGRFRRLPLRRLPDSVVCCLPADVLQVVALAHQRRKRGNWRKRAG
jgi:toxin ParE1/3/4